MNGFYSRALAGLALCCVVKLTVHADAPEALADEAAAWTHVGGDAGGTRRSELAQLDRSNVQRLEVAWTYRTGELGAGWASANTLSFAATPILLEDALYLSTPTSVVIALDAATGEQRWRYDPQIARELHYPELTSRGVAAWSDSGAESSVPCSRRIFAAALDGGLAALDAASGKPCAGFGSNGQVDIVGEGARGKYSVTAPPAVYEDLVIVGRAPNGGAPVEGVVRAFDVRTGALRWSWDPTAPTNAAGASSVFSVDEGRGLVFVSTNAPSPVFYGGKRPGDNAHANSIVALRAQTGELVWSRQLVHHDVWGFDLAAQPVLADLEREGRSLAVVIQATKSGMLFVFERETGEPVFEIIERPTPHSDAPGEMTSPTQPFAATPALVSQAAVTIEDAWGLTIFDRRRCRELIGRYRSEGMFTPPSVQGSITAPSDIGGVNWGGVAFDGERQLALAAVNHLPTVVTLAPRERAAAMRASGEHPQSEFLDQEGAPFVVRREALASPLGLPCTAPPWGTLAAVDLRRNQIRWQVMLGSTRDITPWFVPARTIGMPNIGGPIVTAGGLVFIAAAADNYLRAFDLDTGEELWKGRLPAGGQATPMTYAVNGRQFVVIAAGGHPRLGTTRGDYLIAFALPAG